MRGIFAETKDLMILEGISYQKAWERYQVIKSALAKQKHQRITAKELFNYLGITETDYNNSRSFSHKV